MITNVDAQLEDVLASLTLYWEELRRQRAQIFRKFLKQPEKSYVIVFKFWVVSKNRSLDVLSGKTPEAVRDVLAELLDPPTSDVQQQIRADLIGDFSIHAIAERLVATHAGFDFVAIKKLHESRRVDRLKLTTPQWFAVVLTVAAFVGKSVPHSLVTDMGWAVAQFEHVLFYATCGLLAYVGFLVFFEWSAVQSNRDKHAFFARILAYLELSVPKKSG